MHSYKTNKRECIREYYILCFNLRIQNYIHTYSVASLTYILSPFPASIALISDSCPAMAMDSVLYPSLLLPVDSGKLSSLVIDGALGRPLTSSALCKPNPTSPKVSLSLAPTSGEDLWSRVPFDESDSGVINAMENDEIQWNRLYCDLFVLKDVRSDRDFYAMSASSSSSSVAVQSLLPYSKQSQEDPEKEKDFHVNVGYAIRTLREELPNMFYKELTYEIYRYAKHLYLALGFSIVYVAINLLDEPQ